MITPVLEGTIREDLAFDVFIVPLLRFSQKTDTDVEFERFLVCRVTTTRCRGDSRDYPSRVEHQRPLTVDHTRANKPRPKQSLLHQLVPNAVSAQAEYACDLRVGSSRKLRGIGRNAISLWSCVLRGRGPMMVIRSTPAPHSHASWRMTSSPSDVLSSSETDDQ